MRWCPKSGIQLGFPFYTGISVKYRYSGLTKFRDEKKGGWPLAAGIWKMFGRWQKDLFRCQKDSLRWQKPSACCQKPSARCQKPSGCCQTLNGRCQRYQVRGKPHKKVLFLVDGPLRGESGEGCATKEKRTFFNIRKNDNKGLSGRATKKRTFFADSLRVFLGP